MAASRQVLPDCGFSWVVVRGIGPGVVVEAAQAPEADGAFTLDQAADGWPVYGVQCKQCHGPDLEGMVVPTIRAR